MSVHRTRQRQIALLATLAILFQAILFGWHHHDLVGTGRLPVQVIEKPAATPLLADDADGCEICQVLHHLTGAPIDIAAAPPPLAITAVSVPGDVAFVSHTLALAFRARAPPLA
jgi:hypothetical protein